MSPGMCQHLPRAAAGCSVLAGGAEGLREPPQPGVNRASRGSHFPPGARKGAWSRRRLGRSSRVSIWPGKGGRRWMMNRVTGEKQVQVPWDR